MDGHFTPTRPLAAQDKPFLAIEPAPLAAQLHASGPDTIGPPACDYGRLEKKYPISLFAGNKLIGLNFVPHKARCARFLFDGNCFGSV
jgi:hypothetical protein